MDIVRWNPFQELENVQSRLNRLMGGRSLRDYDEQSSAFARWAPAADVQETDNEYLIKADLPEVKKDDVKVQFEDGVLSVEGERKQEKEEKGKRFHRVEREYGRFVRRFVLPTEVDASAVTAEFKDGVLTVHLPKTPNISPRSIDVKIS